MVGFLLPRLSPAKLLRLGGKEGVFLKKVQVGPFKKITIFLKVLGFVEFVEGGGGRGK